MNTVTNNAQGVTTAIQIFGQQNSMTVQYYFIGFDTTNSSYQSNYLELYSSPWAFYYSAQAGTGIPTYNWIYSNPVRIAYANLSINKSSNYDLFILWLIELQNVPSYLILFIPAIPNPSQIAPVVLVPSYRNQPSSFNVYANNGSCNFTCNGNCPSNSPNNFMLSVQNNTIVLQIPVMIGISGGTSSAEILICVNANYAVTSDANMITFSSSYSTTIVPPSSGYTFYILMTAIAITFTVS